MAETRYIDQWESSSSSPSGDIAAKSPPKIQSNLGNNRLKSFLSIYSLDRITTNPSSGRNLSQATKPWDLFFRTQIQNRTHQSRIIKIDKVKTNSSRGHKRTKRMRIHDLLGHVPPPTTLTTANAWMSWMSWMSPNGYRQRRGGTGAVKVSKYISTHTVALLTGR